MASNLNTENDFLQPANLSSHILRSYVKDCPEPIFAVEDMKEKIQAIFVYSCKFSNFESNRIVGKRSNIQNFEYKANICPFLIRVTE